ncbi:hypothetical protein NEOLEDRAFT_186608 [Neolentinus lepideus HHB14362 ss-1]|uniref:Uncharacterized protein n=1 Tax=Neolentinus lepideus HHB14362 ss-1 TaxID=1314782 RepID=A0A165TQD8_9AGAM|nr:hypothetical protein NEOLEDRAFT_186608 [Neolentinus lepideus HHB14362 ss-1]
MRLIYKRVNKTQLCLCFGSSETRYMPISTDRSWEDAKLFIPDLTNPLHGLVKFASPVAHKPMKLSLFLPSDDDVGAGSTNHNQLQLSWHASKVTSTPTREKTVEFASPRECGHAIAPFPSQVEAFKFDAKRDVDQRRQPGNAKGTIATFHAEPSSYGRDSLALRTFSFRDRDGQDKVKRRVRARGIVNLRHMLSAFEMQDWGKEKVGRLIVENPQEFGARAAQSSDLNSVLASSGNANAHELNVEANRRLPASVVCERSRPVAANVVPAERKCPYSTVLDPRSLLKPAQESTGADRDVNSGIPHRGAKQVGDLAKPNLTVAPSESVTPQKDHPGLVLNAASTRVKSKSEIGGGAGIAKERSTIADCVSISVSVSNVVVRKDDRAPLTNSTLNQPKPLAEPPSTLGKRRRDDEADKNGDRNGKGTKKKKWADVAPEQVLQDVVICNNAIKRILHTGELVQDEKILQDLKSSLEMVDKTKQRVSYAVLSEYRLGKSLRFLARDTKCIPAGDLYGVKTLAKELYEFFSMMHGSRDAGKTRNQNL